MTEPADRAYDMLQRVGEFLKKLPKEKYDALLAEQARLEVVPKGARIVGGGATTRAAPATLPVPADQVSADLAKLMDRTAAAQYIDDLRLKKAQLALLAEHLGVQVSTKHTMAQMRDLIVSQKVGNRLVTDAILRHRA